MGKKRKETKAEKLIRKGAGVPFRRSYERPWQKRKSFGCKQVRPLFWILKYGEKHIKPGYLFRVRRHVKQCGLCRAIGGAILKFG